MNISVKWLNQYLQPANLSTDEAEAALMSVGFPTETRIDLPTTNPERERAGEADTRMDVEVTSNRGDVLCHYGMAREVAAKTGRTLVLPAIPGSTPGGTETTQPIPSSLEQAAKFISVTNPDHTLCPLFTARVIRGVKVGPSPAWLVEALEAVGQRSISNVVDVTNYINLELGNPCHVFDLAKLAGASLIIRFARDKEQLTTLDGKKRTLTADELVVADGERAQSLAGVMGGADSQVTDATVDIVLEMATWDPVTVRRASRRHAVRTEASHRFERIVDQRTIRAAADRAAEMIVRVAGGLLCSGSVEVGRAAPPPLTVRLRPVRCAKILGSDTSHEDIARVLHPLEVQVGPLGRSGDELLCTIPPFRADLTREIDLIEEIARIRGLSSIPVHPTIAVSVRGPQTSELARRELGVTLIGLGFYETITFSFVSRPAAMPFLPSGMKLIEVSEERRKAEPACRPSIIPGLLACRRANQHVDASKGEVRLYEIASVFAEDGSGNSIENYNVALLMDVAFSGKKAAIEDLQRGVRLMRGSIEAVVRNLGGVGVSATFEAAQPHCDGIAPEGFARISLGGKPLGYMGVVSSQQRAMYDLAGPVVVAEVGLVPLLNLYPPKSSIMVPPAFPSIERDVSLIVDEPVTWEAIHQAIIAQGKAPMESVGFVGTFRGAQIGKGKKSVTVRLSYRDDSRTLRHEEIDAPVGELVETMKRTLGATLRL